ALVPARRTGRRAVRRPARSRGRGALPPGRRGRVAHAARPRPAPPARLRARERDGGARAGARGAMIPTGRRPSILQSFNNATEGIIHALRTQRNLWIHFAIAAAVLVAAAALGATRIELVSLPLPLSLA